MVACDGYGGKHPCILNAIKWWWVFRIKLYAFYTAWTVASKSRINGSWQPMKMATKTTHLVPDILSHMQPLSMGRSLKSYTVVTHRNICKRRPSHKPCSGHWQIRAIRYGGLPILCVVVVVVFENFIISNQILIYYNYVSIFHFRHLVFRYLTFRYRRSLQAYFKPSK
jgi:hypothetical protein